MLGVHIGIQKRPESEHTWSAAQQRAFIHAQFSGLGWEFPRIVQAMEKVDDFYFDVLRQVRMPRWSNGPVVLTGDAAWCPTALSGIGTTLAVVGGYVLAGELAKADTPSAAFARYEQIMRPFVDEGQKIPKLLPRLLWPHTRVGPSSTEAGVMIRDWMQRSWRACVGGASSPPRATAMRW
ncbi:oxidoreductase [Xanthomonas citri pv. aurantifolii str. ICPB 10535]|nr:oxidoreductase [Xanthomonas citri pv. aurantifolii str. ICPB 10535]